MAVRHSRSLERTSVEIRGFAVVLHELDCVDDKARSHIDRRDVLAGARVDGEVVVCAAAAAVSCIMNSRKESFENY